MHLYILNTTYFLKYASTFFKYIVISALKCTSFISALEYKFVITTLTKHFVTLEH